ncbi:MAG: hypothetical protein E6G36_02525 [Actinobacteria bacterium]|nr:MAG: hypothetical protein E6G36_02525 [Actinomycetota bacterium]
MRETCARVLAAALMTGAIATVVAMSALFDTPQEVGRALTAPPSSLQRSVGVEVPAAPRHAPAAERLAPARARTRTRTPTVIISRQLVRRTIVVRHTHPPRRQLAAVKPNPAQVVQPAPAPSPAPQPAVTPQPAPSADDPSKGHDGNGQGDEHADDHGHGPGHGGGHDGHED